MGGFGGYHVGAPIATTVRQPTDGPRVAGGWHGCCISPVPRFRDRIALQHADGMPNASDRVPRGTSLAKPSPGFLLQRGTGRGKISLPPARVRMQLRKRAPADNVIALYPV